nr:MAK10-like protein [Tanacetum cinerariifolium]
MGVKNPIRTLGDYSKPSHKGYKNTIELLEGNNVVPLRSDTIRLVQNGCSFHELRSEDPNQHLKDFLKLVDLIDLDVANREKCACDDSDVMFIEIIKKNDDFYEEEPKVDDNAKAGELEAEYFNIFSIRSKLAYHKNEEDKRRGVEYVMSKILRFYKECLELGPEYLTGIADEEKSRKDV